MGCNKLGVMYEKGRGFNKDYKIASELYLKACNLGESEACSSIGSFYEYGVEGIVQDKKVAKEYYRKGCDLGNKVGCDLNEKVGCDLGDKVSCDKYKNWITKNK